MRAEVVVGVFAATLAGCSARQQSTLPKPELLLSDVEENQLGRRLSEAIEGKGVRYLDDPVVEAYVNEVAQRIFAEARKDRPAADWRIHVIDAAKTVDSFTTPGGHIYVATGLLLVATDEAELAAVIAHAAGHTTAGHPTQQMVAGYGAKTASAMALGDEPGLLAEAARARAADGGLCAHSHLDETIADQHAGRYLRAAGYDPRGLPSFIGRLHARSQQGLDNLAWLVTHPAPQERLSALQRASSRQRPAALRHGGGQRLAEIQRRMDTL